MEIKQNEIRLELLTLVNIVRCLTITAMDFSQVQFLSLVGASPPVSVTITSAQRIRQKWDLLMRRLNKMTESIYININKRR